MSALESAAAYAASAALAGVTVIPFGYLCGVNLYSLKRRKMQSQAGRIAIIFLRLAPIFYVIGVALAAAVPGQISHSMRQHTSYNPRTLLYLRLTSTFLITAGAILATIGVYLSAIAVLYMVLAKKKWWAYLRLDALAGVGILLAIDIVWFARSIVIIEGGSRGDRSNWGWLLILIDGTLCLLAAGVLGTAVYVRPKLERMRAHLNVRNLPALLLSASFLWLLRCTFVFAVDLKVQLGPWTREEDSAQKIIYPILDFWVSATVLALVTTLMNNPVWDDPAASPGRRWEAHAQGFEQDSGYCPPPQYSHQQHP